MSGLNYQPTSKEFIVQMFFEDLFLFLCDILWIRSDEGINQFKLLYADFNHLHLKFK